MLKLLTIAGALTLAMTVTPALAHDDDEENTHARAHVEHGDYHEDQAEEHARAHDNGFYNRWQHRAYHRALRHVHEEFHDDHPNTRHDHYRWWQYGYSRY